MQRGAHGVGHSALRVGDLTRAQQIYVAMRGFELMMEAEGVAVIAAHDVPIALLGRPDVVNNGVLTDSFGGATYISFYDPDGIAWELYAMPTG